ncbi:SCO family protein [Streptomyces sp. TRM66268-LWL]|uniref:SCO family protein n=1 Tax=Streptomyces polyasparticus TaxID=2767826 RepID=A0ABR7SI29_9ACTN|nr:SCO family protein [Streptomyces polyasparticus]MBC9714131.1 SCO family protein [Streptomyces polyasparticus]
MRTKHLAAVALLAAASFTLTACGSGDGGDAPAVVSEQSEDKAATVIDKPFEKPDMVLTDTSGKKYDLREQTKGKPTLIYFGYTHCPDACPLTMGNLAVAKKELEKKLPKSELDQLRIIMVTTDPQRDTPEHLGTWMKSQDPSFIGLTGDFPTIQAGARQLGITVEEAVKTKDDKVEAMHGKQVIAFSPKTDAGYVIYNGTEATSDDYVQDLPKIIKGEKP